MSFNIEDIIPCINKHEYSQAIGQFTYLIENTSHNQKNINNLLSVLYGNRGVMQIYENLIELAIGDFTKSLEYYHLNYASYFNLFTMKLQTNTQQNKQALNQLCCSLSCLYLLRGHSHKNQTDINKSIKYCQNNIQARIAKSLIFLTKDNYNLALNQIKWVLDLKPNDYRAIKLCDKIQLLLEIQKQKQKIQSQQNLVDSSYNMNNANNTDIRLVCTLYQQKQLSQQQIAQQIAKKLQQFNEVYMEINGEPFKIKNNQKSSNNNNNNNIYLLYRSLPGTTTTNNNSNNNLIPTNLSNHNQISSSLSIPSILQQQQQINQTSQQQDNNIDSNNNKQIYYYMAPQQMSYDEKTIQKQQLEIIEEQSGFDQLSSVKYNNNNNNNVSQNGYVSMDGSQFNYTMQGDGTSGYTLQALEGDKNLSIKINKIQMNNLQAPHHQNLYCLFEYGNKQFKTLETSHNYNDQNWQDQFYTQLQDQPQVLVVKIFNKQILAYRDRFIGRGQKSLTSIGRISIPIFYQEQSIKNNNNQQQDNEKQSKELIQIDNIKNSIQKLGNIGTVILDVKFK